MSTQVVEHRPVILVVDDNPLIVSVMEGLLGNEGYLVYSAKNGKDALQKLSEVQVDVIVCDVMMPRLDGYGLHEIVRSRASFSHIPFLFLTALDHSKEIRKGMEAGVDDYLTKPFETEDLLSVVKGKISRSRELKIHAEERLDSYKKRVIHTLSHEFRTPLVAINTGTELLLEQKNNIENQKLHGLLEAVYRGGQRLERLVNDFLTLQQIEAGIAKKIYDTRATARPISEVVSVFLDSSREEISKSGFKLYHHDECIGVMVWVFEPQIFEILNRLLNNAMKFSTDPKEVELIVMQVASDVAIDILDRGPGISPERIKEAVDLFGQLDREQLEQQGGGLGLAIASRYADINKGRLEFQNRQGGGTIARLRLPIVNATNKLLHLCLLSYSTLEVFFTSF